jgi:hypothetical protein
MAIRFGKSTTRPAAKATVALFVLLAGLGMAACASEGTSTGADTKSPVPVPAIVRLTASDANKTVRVRVPSTVILTLAYDPLLGDGLAARQRGGAGFSMPHPPVFDDPGSGATSGNEVFTFSMKDKRTLPLVVDDMKPGPITGTPQQFSMTLEGT